MPHPSPFHTLETVVWTDSADAPSVTVFRPHTPEGVPGEGGGPSGQPGIGGRPLPPGRIPQVLPFVYVHLAREEAALFHGKQAEWEAAHGPFPALLVAITGNDWERDFTPWPAPRLFRGSPDFAGGADACLARLTNTLVPAVETRLAGEGFVPSLRGRRLLPGRALRPVRPVCLAHESGRGRQYRRQRGWARPIHRLRLRLPVGLVPRLPGVCPSTARGPVVALFPRLRRRPRRESEKSTPRPHRRQSAGRDGTLAEPGRPHGLPAPRRRPLPGPPRAALARRGSRRRLERQRPGSHPDDSLTGCRERAAPSDRYAATARTLSSGPIFSPAPPLS